MRKVITIVPIMFLIMTLFVSCGGLNGTYIAKNDAAKQGVYQKFIFKGGRVRVIKGAMGIEMPGGYEYGFKREGDKVSIELGIPGVASLGGIELNYNEATDELRLLFGGEVGTALNEYAPVWGKEGSFDPNNPYPDKKEEQQGSVNQSDNKNNPVVSSAPTNENNGKTESFDYKPNVYSQELADTCALYSALAYEDARITTQSDAVQSIQANVEPNPVQTPTPDNPNPKRTKYYGLLSSYKTLKANNNIVYFTGKRSDSYINNNDINKPLVLIAQLQYDGYNSITPCECYHDSDENNISYTLAYKKVNDNETLLAVILRGTDYVEWRGNMDLRDPKNENTNMARHYSFEQANETLQAAIEEYITTNQLKNINYLITGHSRGAAVANLLAVDLSNKGEKVYTYTFATPNNRTDFKDKEYDNIFNFCFDDDFVPQVPLDARFVPGWGYGKSGITYKAIAEGLYAVNTDFIDKENKYITLSESRKPNFNYKATQGVLIEFYKIAPTVNEYYNKDLNMGLGHNPQYRPLYGFMQEYVAQAMVDFPNIGSAAVGVFDNSLLATWRDVYGIANFFFDGAVSNHYIADTHQALTYYNALTSNGFLTK